MPRAISRRPSYKFLGLDKPQSIPEWIVLLAVTGVVLSSPFGGKVFIQEFKHYLKVRAKLKEESLSSKNISQALYRLRKRHIIRIKTKKGKTVILLTEKGRIRKLAYDLERIRIPKPKIWDKHWRFLIFDIPEEMENARANFRNKLKQLGFVQFQKSVWIYPYPCEREVDFLAECFKINKFLTLLTVKVENDRPLREEFSGLKL